MEESSAPYQKLAPVPQDSLESSRPTTNPPTDRAEFFALYTRHSRQLYGYLRAVVPQQADAEDAFQEVSAVLWKKFDSFTPGTNFAAWAMQVARYWVLNWHESKHRQPISTSDDLLESIALDSLEMNDALEAQHAALADCYQQLNVDQRRLVDRRYRSGISVRQLADEEQQPLRSMYRLLEQIHAALLRCIDRKLGKDASP